MKRTVRENIKAPYSLHDRNVISFEVHGNAITMRTQSGILRCTGPAELVDGYVEFHDVQWDFSYVYLLDPTGNSGHFTGEKLRLRDFLKRYTSFGFSVIDEVYGYNQTKYWGHLTAQGECKECILEIYHEGDMAFVEET